MGLIAEHTQGLDVKSHLRHWDKYDSSAFLSARATPPFRKMEQSWREIDDYLTSCLRHLPPSLRAEAMAALRMVDHPQWQELRPSCRSKVGAVGGLWSASLLGGTLSLDSLTYRVYAAADYDYFQRRYLRAPYGWAFDDLGKTGLSASNAVSAVLRAHVKECRQRKEKGHIHTVITLGLTPAFGGDSCMLPQAIPCNGISMGYIKGVAIRTVRFQWLHASSIYN